MEIEKGNSNHGKEKDVNLSPTMIDMGTMIGVVSVKPRRGRVSGRKKWLTLSKAARRASKMREHRWI